MPFGIDENCISFALPRPPLANQLAKGTVRISRHDVLARIDQCRDVAVAVRVVKRRSFRIHPSQQSAGDNEGGGLRVEDGLQIQRCLASVLVSNDFSLMLLLENQL